MGNEILLDMIKVVEQGQKRIEVTRELIKEVSGISIIEFRPKGNELFLHEGIEKLAEICGKTLLFVPVDYESENWGNAYFYHDGIRVFQIINEEELIALGGDAV